MWDSVRVKNPYNLFGKKEKNRMKINENNNFRMFIRFLYLRVLKDRIEISFLYLKV